MMTMRGAVILKMTHCLQKIGMKLSPDIQQERMILEEGLYIVFVMMQYSVSVSKPLWTHFMAVGRMVHVYLKTVKIYKEKLYPSVLNNNFC
jgi:uncharacterized protein (DUF983 family)